MKLIGLSGPARVGKDTVADYLVENHGFLKFSFSDSIYREVQRSYGLFDQSVLRANETKDTATSLLALNLANNKVLIGSTTIGQSLFPKFTIFTSNDHAIGFHR